MHHHSDFHEDFCSSQKEAGVFFFLPRFCPNIKLTAVMPVLWNASQNWSWFKGNVKFLGEKIFRIRQMRWPIWRNDEKWSKSCKCFFLIVFEYFHSIRWTLAIMQQHSKFKNVLFKNFLLHYSNTVMMLFYQKTLFSRLVWQVVIILSKKLVSHTLISCLRWLNLTRVNGGTLCSCKLISYRFSLLKKQGFPFLQFSWVGQLCFEVLHGNAIFK